MPPRKWNSCITPHPHPTWAGHPEVGPWLVPPDLPDVPLLVDPVDREEHVEHVEAGGQDDHVGLVHLAGAGHDARLAELLDRVGHQPHVRLCEG